ALLDVVSSANLACGFHAGDFMTMQQTVAAAMERGVAIGAHVSLPDLQGFGRREMRVTPAEVHAMTLYQLGALHGFAHAAGTRLSHVRPDGTLQPRSEAGAVIDDAGLATAQALQIALDGTVTAIDGSTIAMRADTLCLHGDGVHAARLARSLRAGLEAAGVTITATGEA